MLFFSIAIAQSSLNSKQCDFVTRIQHRNFNALRPPLLTDGSSRCARLAGYPTNAQWESDEPFSSSQNSSQPQRSLLIDNQDSAKSRPSFWTGAVVELLAGVLGMILCKVCNLPVLGSKFMLTPSALLHACQAAVPFCLIFWLIELVPTGIRQMTDERFREFFESRSALQIAIFCMCVSVGEEFLFRSWLLAGLCTLGFAPLPALAVSSSIFGVLHAYTALYMVLATLAGFLFGTMFLTTGSVLQPLIVHFLYDFLTLMIMKSRWQSPSSVK